MSKTILTYFFKVLVLIVAQAVIFNHLILFQVAVPMVFIYAIISMPVTWSAIPGMLVGFAMGLGMDIFQDTLGVNTIACTVLAFVRRGEFHLYMQHDEDLNGQKPSSRSMGAAEFVKYSLTMTLTYCTLAFLIEAFAIFDPLRLALQIVSSTAYTFILIYAINTVFTRKTHT